MTFEDKYLFALKELEKSKIWKSNYNPPLLKGLHKLGFKIPPPHYNTFLNNMLLMGGYFAIFWGLFMYFSTWKNQGLSISFALLASICTGLLFGTFLAMYFKFSAKKHNLTPWSEI